MDNILKFDYYYGDEAEQFTFYRIPRLIIKDDRFKNLSNDAKLLYGLMLDNLSLSKKNEWFDEDNRVYIHYTIEAIQEDLNCSCGKAVSMVKELINFGLIEKKRMGQGKADIIYVKNFIIDDSNQNNKAKNSTGKNFNIKKTNIENSTEKNSNTENSKKENSNIQNSKNQNSKNESSSSSKNESLEFQNLEANYNNINNTDYSYTNHIHLSGESDNIPDGIDVTKLYMQVVKTNIGYDYYMNNPEYLEKNLFEEIYNTIIDLVCVTRKSIRISGEDYPYAMVKDRMLKLRSEHVEYVIDMIGKNTKEITNMKAYLITALYNAPTTYNIYLSQKIQHDLYGGE